ncbi:MAG TPA: helix-turn-helix domain-containing protein [Kiloniellaceae bacterium]|nr:helix-turn-helix domain-containing protein [Kiloniellaceae bacterium]
MIEYGQYCPVARAAEILNERWTLLIMRDLLGGARRFSEIRRGVPRMSPSLLTKRLRDLEAAGLISRKKAGRSSAMQYVPTQAGLEVKPIVDLYGVWGQRWVRNRLGEDELDVSLLMWYLRCGIDRSFFPGERNVVHFHFTDRPRLKKDNWWVDQWWLLITADETDLCVQDPGHEIDLYVVSDLRTMTKVSVGDIPVRKAVRDQLIELHGSRSLARSFVNWLPRSPLASVARPPEPLDLQYVVKGMKDCSIA